MRRCGTDAPPPPGVLSRDALLSCGVRALRGARAAASHAAAPCAAHAGAPPAWRVASAAEPSKALGYAKDVAAGTAGGIAVVLVGHPFDTLKVLLQTQPSDKPIYNGVVDAAKARAARRGRRGRGTGVRCTAEWHTSRGQGGEVAPRALHWCLRACAACAPA
jgi:hypothetical protein